MLADDIKHYLSEIKRVLKPGGSCFFTAFILDRESKKQLRRGLTKDLTFNHQMGESYIQSLRHSRGAVAYSIETIGKLLTDENLELKVSIKFLERN